MLGALLALALAPVAVDALAAETAIIERAIEKGRLVQAHNMLDLARRKAGRADATTLYRLDGLLALSERRDGDAFLAFSKASQGGADDCRISEGLGIAAVRLGRERVALKHLTAALDRCPARGLAWNALGVLNDRRGAWRESEVAYARAAAQLPDSPLVANNHAWSLILQRRYAEAIDLLERQAMRTPGNRRTALNMDIALVVAGKAPLPRRADESDDDWSARLNSPAYVAYLSGDSTALNTLLDTGRNGKSTATEAGQARTIAIMESESR